MIKIPKWVAEFMAEMFGTFLLVLLGDGAIAQKTGMNDPFLSVAFGYGFALMIGILVSGGVSGGHLNPAVTLSMAAIGKCKWRQVPVYMLAQFLGAFIGAAVLYLEYAQFISSDITAGGLGGIDNAITKPYGIFASYPANFLDNEFYWVSDQVLGTAILLIIINAATDKKNMNLPSGMIPLTIGLGLTSIHISLALNAGCAINPARDFMPRLFTLIAGAGSKATFNSNGWWLVPWLAPFLGGPLGAVIYKFMIEVHLEEVE